MTSTTEAENRAILDTESPPPFIMPPLRTYKVRKVLGSTIKDYVVQAHLMQYVEDRTVQFVLIERDPSLGVSPHVMRIICNVEDAEEVMVASTTTTSH
jgi:hypothetical protein